MRAHPAYADVPCEPLHELPGARVVERIPSAGMRYRLYIAASASAENPARLLVWLHPSGGSMTTACSRDAGPDLLAHGWALMIVPPKRYEGGDQDGLNRRLGCVAAAYQDQAIERRQPVPLTFSAGGQLAPEIWFQQPDYWSALVLDAAYPTDYRTGQPRPLSQPQMATKLPVLAIIGASDPSGAPWGRPPPSGRPRACRSRSSASRTPATSSSTRERLDSRTLAWLDDLKRTCAGPRRGRRPRSSTRRRGAGPAPSTGGNQGTHDHVGAPGRAVPRPRQRHGEPALRRGGGAGGGDRRPDSPPPAARGRGAHLLASCRCGCWPACSKTSICSSAGPPRRCGPRGAGGLPRDGADASALPIRGGQGRRGRTCAASRSRCRAAARAG